MAGTKEPVPPGHGRILVMDDEETVLRLAGKMLARIGYKVSLAKDGSEAVELYEKARGSADPFDAVILDLTVPGGMGGKDAIKRLREIDPGIKAIVSSGYSTDRVMADYESFGFSGVVAKPYEFEELARVVGQVLTMS